MATPICSLETELYIPRLDIFPNKRLANFPARLERMGMAN